MPLHWLLDDVVVDESVFTPGKQLMLDAEGSTSPPEFLQVFQVYSSAMRQILKHVGIPDRRSGSYFRVVTVRPDHYRSESAWRLPEPRGWRKSSTYVFAANDSTELSGFIYSSRVGKASIGFNASVKAADPSGLVPLGVDGMGTLRASLRFASDPTLEAHPLTGRQLVDHMLASLTEDLGNLQEPSATDVRTRIDLGLTDLRDSLMEAYSSPPDWTFQVSNPSAFGDEGDVVETTITLMTPSPGDGYFALQWHDATNGEGETTDAWVIKVDSNLHVSVDTDPSETPLPELMTV